MSRLYLVIFLSFSFSVVSQDFTKQYYEHALKQKEAGDYLEAIEYFKKVLEADSNKIEVLWEYAETVRLFKDYREAERLYRKIYEREEAKLHLRSLFYWGEMQKNNGKYEEAVETFKLAKKKYAFDKNEYLYQKSIQELESCLWARKAVKDTLELTVEKLPPPVNTADSEFGHTIFNSTLFFSSLKGDSTKVNEEILGNKYRTGIYSAELPELKIMNQQKDLGTPEQHVANGSFSLDKKRYYFSSCKETADGLRCKIVMARYADGMMQSPDTLGDVINEENANTTMPFIAKFDQHEVLFFASDRSGTKGGLDIYYAYVKDDGANYSEPFPVEAINTRDHELSPFYDSIEEKLYFSSSWHHGFGGYDIFYSPFVNYKFGKPVNAGIPVNSPANDLYYFKNKANSYFSSNRVGVTYVSNPTCCSDIFRYSEFPPVRDIDSSSVHQDTLLADRVDKSEFKSLEDLNKKLPVTLYFHNDVPNPKSIDTVTSLNYLTTYDEYVNMIPQYKKEYAKGLSGDKAKDAEEDIESFFIEYVNQGVRDLDIFRELLLKELQENKSIVLTVKGFASPLAKSDYNVNLTRRRISSLENYLREYEKGVFLPYLDHTDETATKLIIRQIPYGEYVANKLVSDNPNDMKNSIFSRAAGLERKIEIQSVSYLKNDSSNFLIAKNQIQDLGKIDPLKIYTRKFQIKSSGPKAVEISKIDIPCSCNTANISKMKLNPNETATLEVSFDPKGYSGKIVKSVYIYTENSTEPLRIVLTGEIK